MVENGIIFRQPGGVQILTRTDRDHSFWHGLETNNKVTVGNYVWHMLNIMMMSVSNTICVLYINCKTGGFLFLVDSAPGGQIYVSTFSHQNYWYYWWFLLHWPVQKAKQTRCVWYRPTRLNNPFPCTHTGTFAKSQSDALSGSAAVNVGNLVRYAVQLMMPFLPEATAALAFGCRCLRLSVRPSVCVSVCLSVTSLSAW